MDEKSSIGSQSSQMDEKELNELDTAAQPERTAKPTRWAMTRLKDWLKKRHIDIDVKSVTAEELAPILRRFYGELKTFDGRESPNAQQFGGHQSRNPARANPRESRPAGYFTWARVSQGQRHVHREV